MNGHNPPLHDKQIALQSFTQRVGAWPDDDWSGVTDPKQRRKLQNRLNQRARRKSNFGQSAISILLIALNIYTGLRNKRDGETQQSSSAALDAAHPGEMSPTNTVITATSSPSLLREIDNVHILHLDFPETKVMMQRLETIAHYMLGSPRTDLLLHLTQLNFTRALMENTRILGLTSDTLHDDAISPFNTAGPWQYDFEYGLPSTLQPTMVQRSIEHHPWLDLIPVPQMRDNLICDGEWYDEAQLCLDMKGSGSVRDGGAGIIVWRDPWDPAGWEVTEAFAHSWGWVIWNCYELFQSTNHWRAKRNEDPLFRT